MNGRRIDEGSVRTSEAITIKASGVTCAEAGASDFVAICLARSGIPGVPGRGLLLPVSET